MRILLYSILLAALLPAVVGLDCGCLNSGQCLEKGPTNSYCHCAGGFLDVQCGQAGSELVQAATAAAIGEDYSYYFVTFNVTTLYFVQFIVCPTAFQLGTVFEIFIEMEGEDGSLEQHPQQKDKNLFRPESTQCMVFKIVLLAFQIKPSGDYTRLVLRVRSFTPTNLTALRISDPQEQSLGNVLKLSTIKYELYEGMQDFQIGQFLALSTLSILCVFFVSFVICRRFVRHRIPRYHYQPAQPVHDILHFETLMPSSQFERNGSLAEDEKECMICLLGVELTQVRRTPCGHLFHTECIDEWGRKKPSCPTCRASLLPRGEGEESQL